MSRHYEPDSDDDSVVDEDEVFIKVPTTMPSTKPLPVVPLDPSALQSVEVINENELLDISAQILGKEAEADVEFEKNIEKWEKEKKPVLKKTVDRLEEQIDKLKDQLEKSPSDEMEDALDGFVAEHKKASCELFFPQSVHRMGSGGVYCALDDFWLETVTGKFDLELLPAMGSDVSQLVFVMNGQESSPGVAAKFHMTNFKLKGDHLLVPSLIFDDMDVDVVFTVTVVLSFNIVEKKWHIDEDDFKLDVLEFDGPFGLTTGVLGAILGIVTPLVRRQVLKELPVELGALIASLPCPLQVNGVFQADGQPCWDEVKQPLVGSSSICNLMGQAPAEVLNFQAIQRSMQRPANKLMTTLSDVIAYQRKYKNTSHWILLQELWQDAALAYYARTSQMEPSDTADDPSQQAFSSCLSIEKLFLGVTAAAKVPVGVHVDVKMVEGQFGIKTALEQSNLFAKRMIDEMSRATDKNKGKGKALTSAEQHLLESMKAMVLKNTDLFDFLLKRVDFMQGKSSVHVVSGAEAELTGTFDNLSGQFPVSLLAPLPTEKIIGGNIIVPTLTKLQTSKEGVLSFLFYQLGSVAMLEKCNLHKWFLDELDEDPALSALQLAELHIHRPLFSFIMDQPVPLAPGAELFSVQVGPQSDEAKKMDEKCPLIVKTSEQVKMLGKVPLVTTSVYLTRLVGFINKHFEDIEVLLDVISLSTGAKRETCMQYLNFAKMALGILTKYVIKPGLVMDVNMSTRVIANALDIIVCLENRLPGMSAVRLEAKIDFREIISDLTTLKGALFSAINHKAMIF